MKVAHDVEPITFGPRCAVMLPSCLGLPSDLVGRWFFSMFDLVGTERPESLLSPDDGLLGIPRGMISRSAIFQIELSNVLA